MSARARPRVCLLAPGLFGPLAAGGVSVEARDRLFAGLSLTPLETLLSRADVVPQPVTGGGIEPLLASVFGLAVDATAGVPVAALTREMDVGDAGAAAWLRADPVHLRAALAEATMLHPGGPSPGLVLSAEEAKTLQAVVNEALAEESLHVEAVTAQRWYLRLDETPDARFFSPAELAGGSLRDRLPSGADGARWRRLLTLTQTALHDCPVNISRESAGVPPVNSLWFFGAGRLPARPAPRFTLAWCASELTMALARHAGIPVSSMPADVAGWLASRPEPGEHLLVFEACHEAVCSADAGAWLGALQTLQEAWIAPLGAALRDGLLGSLRLVTDDGDGFDLSRGSLRCFWRRRRPFAVIAAEHVRGSP